MPFNIYLEHCACLRRALDTSRFERYFRANGCTITRYPRKADYILFISCALIKVTEDYSIKRIKKLSRYKGRLIVGGCLKGIRETRLRENFTGFAFTPSMNEDIDKLFPDFNVRFCNVPDGELLYPVHDYTFALRVGFRYFKGIRRFEKEVLHSTYFLSVCNGCIDQHCSYCNIWKAIGRLKSKPMENCISEFRCALQKGFKRFTLVGDNTGAYGLDIGLTFMDLLEELLRTEGSYSLKLDELNPMWLIKYIDRFLEAFRSGKIRSMLCPLQSGNDRILRLMNRRHTAVELKNVIARIKKVCPALELHTHVMVGFSSETDEEFQESLDFVRDTGFHMVLIVAYRQKPVIIDPSFVHVEIDERTIRKRITKAVKFCKQHKIYYDVYA